MSDDLAHAHATIARLRESLYRASALISDLATGAEEQSQSHVDVLHKIDLYYSAELAAIPPLSDEDRARVERVGMAVVQRIMRERARRESGDLSDPAPDLLIACEAALSYIVAGSQGPPPIVQLRAAIAKARGVK